MLRKYKIYLPQKVKLFSVDIPGADYHSSSGAGHLHISHNCSYHRYAPGGVLVCLSIHSRWTTLLCTLCPLQIQPYNHG